jgi:hypothetical protein
MPCYLKDYIRIVAHLITPFTADTIIVAIKAMWVRRENSKPTIDI